MSVMFILVGLSLVFAVAFLVVFIRSVKSGQFDDDYTPSVRILFDNTIPSNNLKKQSNAGRKV